MLFFSLFPLPPLSSSRYILLTTDLSTETPVIGHCPECCLEEMRRVRDQIEENEDSDYDSSERRERRRRRERKEEEKEEEEAEAQEGEGPAPRGAGRGVQGGGGLERDLVRGREQGAEASASDWVMASRTA